MRYRRLDENGDMTFGAGSLNFLVDSPDAVAQAVMTRLKLWAGEWFLDVTAGTPWQDGGLGYGKRDMIDPMVRERILETENVTEITAYASQYDVEKRKFSIQATIQTAFGAATINEVL